MYDRYKRTLRHLQGEVVQQKTIDEAIIFGVLGFETELGDEGG